MNPLDETLPPASPPSAGDAAFPSRSPKADAPAGDTSALGSVSTAGEVTIDYVPGSTAGNVRTGGPANAPQRFGNHELLETIGAGGMGVVYKARQLGLNRIVALKRIRAGEFAEAGDVQRFHAEAEAAAALDHPGIVPIYEVGDIAGQPFFSMGFVDGESLQQRLMAGPLEPREAARITEQVAEAVQYAHEHGIIHRDLKPGNILLDGAGQPRVTDFGLAKRTAEDSGLTMTGQVLGTPAYMPPEQARGEQDRVGAQSDVYALGAVLYAALTGRPPFQAATFGQTLRQVVEEDPVAPRALNRSIPVDLESIALKCLEKEPTRRYASAADLAADLRRWQEGLPTIARPVSRVERLARWARRNPVPATLLSLSALLLVAVSIISTAAWLRASADAEEKTKLVDEKSKLAGDMSKLAAEKTKLADEKTKLAGEMTVLAGKESTARQETERQLRIATANRLAAQSTSLLNERPVTALLLAVAAAESTKDLGDTMTPSVVDALRNGVSNVGGYPLTGHSHYITGVTFTPNNRWLLTGSIDGTSRLWDLRSPEPSLNPKVLEVDDTGPVYCQAISPDGRWLATGGYGSTRLWDLEASDANIAVTLLPGHEGQVSCVSFSADGRSLATVGYDMTVRVWDLDAPDPAANPRVLHGKAPMGGQIGFSPNGRWLFTSSTYSGAVSRIWDLQASSLTDGSNMLLDQSWVYSFAFIPEGGRLITGGREVRIWDVESNEFQFRESLHGLHHSGIFACLALSQDGRWLAGGSSDTTVRVWNMQATQPSRTERVLRGHKSYISCMKFSPDGRWLVTGSGDKTIRLWDLEASDPHTNVRVLRGHNGDVTSLSISADSQWVASGANEDSIVRLWNLGGGEFAASPKVIPRVPGEASRNVVLSPNGRWLISGIGPILVRDLHAPNRDLKWNYRVLHGRPGYETCWQISPDSSFLAVGTQTGVVIWDLESENPLANPRVLPASDSPVTCLAISHNGRWLAAGAGNDGFVWDLRASETEAARRTFAGHQEHITCAAFSLDGRWFVTGSADKTVRIWDLLSDRQAMQSMVRNEFRGASSLAWGAGGRLAVDFGSVAYVSSVQPTEDARFLQHVSCLTMSSDGRWLALGALGGRDQAWQAQMWDLRANEPTLEGKFFEGQVKSPIETIAVSTDGRWLGAGLFDSTTAIWDFHTSNPAAHVQVLPGNGRPVDWLAISPDGRWVATREAWNTRAQTPSETRLWLIEPGDLVELAKSVAGRDLMPQERSQFDVSSSSRPSTLRPPLPPLFTHEWHLTPFQPSTPGPPLISPAAGATVDNGTQDGKKEWSWNFEWNAIPNARCYHLHIKGDNSAKPLYENATLTSPKYRFTMRGHVVGRQWNWKVRAQTFDGVWTDWSESTFNVAPPGITSPPSPNERKSHTDAE
jgi:WD40 repeat protein/serine/threonine protein kinase